MLKQFFINKFRNLAKQGPSVLAVLFVLFLLAMPLNLYCQGTNSGDLFFAEKGPIEITSEKLYADNRTNRSVFEGSVVARQGMTVLYADRMEVVYTEKGDVEEIIATGNVRLVKGDREVTSSKAHYFQKEGKIVFTGSPVAKDSKSTVSGTKMVYYIQEGKSIVENSKVILKRANTRTNNEQ